MKANFSIRVIWVILICGVIFSCEDFVDVDPPNSSVSSDAIYEKDELAISAMEGIYHRLFQLTGFAGGGSYSVMGLSGLSADEFDLYNIVLFATLPDFRQNQIDPANQANMYIWASAYNTIYMTNSLLEGLANSTEVTTKIRRQLEGEAKFVRAFAYFYLVNLYGDVPLIVITDYTKNALAPKVSVEEVYEQIIRDLTEARDLLGDEYINSERTRPNSFAASALLARVYLYHEDWAKAENLATEVIAVNSQYGLLNDLGQVFLANSKEAIWQIDPLSNAGRTYEASNFIVEAFNYFLTPASFTNSFIDAFETGDKRLTHWVGIFDDGTNPTVYYPYKYKVILPTIEPTEYSTVIRLVEQYLVRAEARMQQGNISGAQQDLNAVRNRAGLGNTLAGSQEELMDAILQERRVEFFAEGGHRWLDLKRTGRADSVLAPLKPDWQSTDVLYPIPEQEIGRNPNLIQNDGY
ncbi:RagB/SusD family nutrient uptake outer membrane protein [Sinomicrobium pectinilyticum]|uniref:RagB/SusD family nutrient uptake outer membrane protein n=1 Tax=Sinomicrobium pectinilyticum TaxID=1084421 RepID=A0A3N0EQI9_SINP1|nr:RagB/SusD family nutrient uptake outer membrane protein [Sinomicrobium pectinilyticum]RNL90103.1 RagB/SusD family nutrient uptake outer membrane protein [Sinomicrobium pectinilyticum]